MALAYKVLPKYCGPLVKIATLLEGLSYGCLYYFVVKLIVFSLLQKVIYR